MSPEGNEEKIRRVTKERHDVMNFTKMTSIPLNWDGGRRTGNLIGSGLPCSKHTSNPRSPSDSGSIS